MALAGIVGHERWVDNLTADKKRPGGKKSTLCAAGSTDDAAAEGLRGSAGIYLSAPHESPLATWLVTNLESQTNTVRLNSRPKSLTLAGDRAPGDAIRSRSFATPLAYPGNC